MCQRKSNKPAGRGIRWKPVIEAKSRRLQARSDNPGNSTPVSTPGPSQSESLGARVAQVLQSTANTGSDILIMAEYLPEVPARIGHIPALHVAIETMLFSHLHAVNR